METVQLLRRMKYHLAPNICKIAPKANMVNLYFLYLYIRSKAFKLTIGSYIGGSSQPTIPMKTLRILEIPYPKIDIQNKIVQIAYSIDEKIRVNTLVNKNLEAQARTIYRDMFGDTNVDFKVGQLSDIADITMGQSPKGDTYNETGEGTIFYQGRAEFGFRFPTQRLFTTEPKRMAQENDVLMSVRAPVGDINIAHEICCIGRGLAAIRSKCGCQSFILYTMYSLREQIDIFNGEGTVFGSINRAGLNSLSVQIPSQEKIRRFEELVEPMDNAIRKYHDENIQLTAIRDTLIPRLMSGEIDVSSIEI